MKNLINQTTKFCAVILVLIAVQSSNLFAQQPKTYEELEKLYDAKNYAEIGMLADNLLPASKSDSLQNAFVYLMRGTSRLNHVYFIRTGTEYGKVVSDNRASLEVRYNADTVKYLDAALADLKKASLSAGQTDGSGLGLSQVIEVRRNVARGEALIWLEKAQFVTGNPTDFTSADQFSFIRSMIAQEEGVGNIGTSRSVLVDEKPIPDAVLLAAEILTKVGRGDFAAADKVFVDWMKMPESAAVNKRTATPKTALAYDATGNYLQTRAFILRETIRQIRADGGKFVAANQPHTRNAMKAHLRNLNAAFAGKTPAAELTPLECARRAGVFYLKGNQTASEIEFIKTGCDTVFKVNKEIPPADSIIYSVRLQLDSTNEADKAKARKKLDEILQKDPKNAAALAVRGYANLLKGDNAAAEIDLTNAIKANPLLAYVCGAHTNRAAVYKKLGKIDLAAADEKEAVTLDQLLSSLAAAS